MLYAVSLWTFHEKGTTLPGLVAQFADAGFNAMSLAPPPLLAVDPGEARETIREMECRGLPLTLHADFSQTDAEWDFLFDCCGTRLRCITFDAAWTSDSCGHFYDASGMAARLGNIAARSEGSVLRFGVEDFPLDAKAMAYYRDALAPVLDNPRFGMLVDLGHMNLRMHAPKGFGGRTPLECLQALPLPVIEVHVHDNDGRRDLHQPIGDGNADFSGMADALRAIGFDGVSTIEVAPSFHGSDGAADMPKTVESRIAWEKLLEKE